MTSECSVTRGSDTMQAHTEQLSETTFTASLSKCQMTITAGNKTRFASTNRDGQHVRAVAATAAATTTEI